jgi:cytochrome c oxidase subunit 4
MADSSMTPEEVDHHVAVYLKVFLALLMLTVLTVVVAEFRFAVVTAIVVALVIASVKGSLVAYFFMHLKWEKMIIFATLALTVVFFLFLLFIPYLTSGTTPTVIYGS